MDQPSKPSPFGLFERTLALRYLRATRKGAGISLISIIAFAGITLSVATLIVVMSVMQGFRFTLLDQLLGVNGHVFLQPQAAEVYQDDGFVETLEDIPGVQMAVPVLKIEAFSVNGSIGQAPVYVQGMAKDDLLKIKEVSGPGAVLQGSYDAYGEGRFGGNGIAIASGVARKIGAQEGDIITLIRGGGIEPPFAKLPTTQKNYRVDSSFSIGNYEYDNLYVYMPLAQAKVFAGKKGQITEIEMRVDNAMEIDGILPAIESAVDNNFIVFDWRDRFRTFFNALEVERALVRIILAMIIAVATLLIFNGLWMQVKDKNSDIAVLRTMGATNGAILRIFLMIGGLIGVLGALSGVALGSLIASNIGGIEKFLCGNFNTCMFPPDVYYLDEVPSIFEPSEVLGVLAFTLALSLIFSAYPAWRASRLDPVEALRYE